MNCMLQTWDLGEMLKATIGQAHSSRKQVARNLFCWSFIYQPRESALISSKQLRTIFFPCCFALALLLVIQRANAFTTPISIIYRDYILKKLWEIPIFLADMNKTRLEIKKGGGDSKFCFWARKACTCNGSITARLTNPYNRFENFPAFETGEISSALPYWN